MAYEVKHSRIDRCPPIDAARLRSLALHLGSQTALAASRAPRQDELRVMLGCAHEDAIAEVQARLEPWISSARQSRAH